MKKLLVIAGIILVVGAGYLIFSKKEPVSTELEKVTVAQTADFFLYAPLYVAKDKGFFKDQGLDVDIVTAGGDEKAFASLLSGDAQFAVGDPTFVAIAGEKGQPGKVVGALLNGVPFWGVADKPNIPTIDNPSQIAPYTVATFPAPSTAYVLQERMFIEGTKFAGLRRKVNIKETAFGALIPALKNGSVDIALELEPNVSLAVKNGSHIVYSLSQYYPDFAVTGVTVLPSYIQSNPQTIQKFLNALQQADTFIRANPAEVAQLLARRFSDVPQDVAVAALNNTIAANVIPKDLVTSQVAWDAAAQLRRDVGDLKERALFETYVDNSFAEKAR